MTEDEIEAEMEERKRLRRLAEDENPGDIVQIARKKTHPLHRYFEWDDTEAAKRYRVSQAHQ